MIGRRALLLAAILLLVASPAFATRHATGGREPLHHRMEGARIGDPAVGKQLFLAKGCATCHAIKGAGASVGPDLGKLLHTHNLYQMAAVMWNHATEMQRVMEEKGVKRPQFKGDEMAHLLAYLHSLEVVGDVERGKAAFSRRAAPSATRSTATGASSVRRSRRRHIPIRPSSWRA